MPDIWMDVDTALSEVPINIFPLTDDTDFKTREEALTYDQAGLDLVWNFVTTAGAFTQTAVTPTTGGDYDWAHQGNGVYTIEIPASGGASINNDTEGFGWFVGYATGVMPWRGPVVGFRAAALNNALIDGGDLIDVNVTHVADTAQTANDNGADINAILEDTGTTLPATLATIDGIVDDILVDTAEIGAAGAGLTEAGGTGDQLTDIIGADADTLKVLSDQLDTVTTDTNELQTDWTNGGRLDLIIDAILADTNELQGDWTNGGRLDLIIDELTSQGDTNEGKIDTVDTNVDTLVARLTAARAGYLDELDVSTSGKTSYYAAKMAIALLNKLVITEANGNTEQFTDAGASIGTINAAFSSDGTYTTRLRQVQ